VDLDLRTILEDTGRLVARFGDEAHYVALCVRSGVIGVELPHRVAQMLRAFDRFGTLGGAVSVASIRSGGRIGLIDELGSLSFRELDRRSNALANGWRERGLEGGDAIAILTGNHRGSLDAMFAAAKCGARIALLDTDSSGAKIRRAMARDGTDLLVYDDEFARLVKAAAPRYGRWRARSESGGDDTLAALIAAQPASAPPKPSVSPRIVGASGSTERWGWHELAGLLSQVPLRAREVTECCVPISGAPGFAQAMLAVSLGSTLVVRRSFDPAATLGSLDRNQASALVVTPAMLRRLLDLGEDARASLDLAALRMVLVVGSPLGAELRRHTEEAFGPVVYALDGAMEAPAAPRSLDGSLLA
jgi:fatty-acyl-CoA synthase